MAKLTWYEIAEATNAMVVELNRLGIKAVLIGSAACQYYYDRRKGPDDIDLVLLTRCNAEKVKTDISLHNSCFEQRNAKSRRGRTYLMYHLSGGGECKVDLIPRRVKKIPFPRLLKSEFEYSEDLGVAVMPLFPLLLLKVHGWWGRGELIPKKMQMIREGAKKEAIRNISRMLQRPLKKRPADESDIISLMALVLDLPRDERDWWLARNESFAEKVRSSVQNYIRFFPETYSDWKELGFEF